MRDKLSDVRRRLVNVPPSSRFDLGLHSQAVVDVVDPVEHVLDGRGTFVSEGQPFPLTSPGCPARSQGEIRKFNVGCYTTSRFREVAVTADIKVT